MSEETPITIGLLITILVIGLPILWKAFQIHSKIRWLCAREQDKWTLPQHRLWAERLRNRNPALNVPDVDEVVGVLEEHRIKT